MSNETLKLPLLTSACACGASHHHRPDPSDDARLVAALLSGDERAWRELICRHGPSVRRCITGVTSRFRGVVSSDDEAEIFATFCLRLLQNDRSKLAAFDASRGAALGTWLGMVAIQTAYDFLRQRRREKNRDHRAPLEAMAASGPDPFDRYLEQQRLDVARKLLDQITPRDREFLTELCSESFEPSELARQMGIRLSTVYTKKHKLIGRLARLAAA
jgi:RNA polymerase sigma-70 factor (ECF subfamily)